MTRRRYCIHAGCRIAPQRDDESGLCTHHIDELTKDRESPLSLTDLGGWVPVRAGVREWMPYRNPER